MSNTKGGIEVKVVGQVQGVFFRQGVKEVAEELGLTGWVRNEKDGAVKIIAEGEEENLHKLIEWCKEGTEWAKVERVEIEWREGKREFGEFSIH